MLGQHTGLTNECAITQFVPLLYAEKNAQCGQHRQVTMAKADWQRQIGEGKLTKGSDHGKGKLAQAEDHGRCKNGSGNLAKAIGKGSPGKSKRQR